MNYEEPIYIYIFPFGSDGYEVSHAAMSYGDDVINFGGRGFSLSKFALDEANCYKYEVSPSKAGIDTEKLQQAMRDRVNKIKGEDYNFFMENCADQVVACLREAGAQDVKETLGVAIPKLGGFNSLDNWAEKHGKLVQAPAKMIEKVELRNYIKSLFSVLGRDGFERPTSFQKMCDYREFCDCMGFLKDKEGYKHSIKSMYETNEEGGMFHAVKQRSEYMERYMLSKLSEKELVDRIIKTTENYHENEMYGRLMRETICDFVKKDFESVSDETIQSLRKFVNKDAKSDRLVLGNDFSMDR